jgi:hypothetical protein
MSEIDRDLKWLSSLVSGNSLFGQILSMIYLNIFSKTLKYLPHRFRCVTQRLAVEERPNHKKRQTYEEHCRTLRSIHYEDVD